ncbi:hypothetical protein [Sphingobacterium sp. JB170]|uniref:hypothetical protein n=1 Tax=Sphingobacterium sp. JB170 TaxID=1434842 RepID=UPI00097F26DF|nr:hypothetical protein [Sphingobacterium sp. JB170]SJN50532.1 hypothetical protein FM107_20715 [Sphingobacterium sp. JB170]
MEAKFKLFDKVIVSGTATGYGNLEAVIIEVSFDELSKQFFYNTRTDQGRFYVAEKFLKII